MPDPPNDLMLAIYQDATMLLSLATGLTLLAARWRGPLLNFEPRRLVPWNAAGAMLAVVFVSFTVLTAISGQTSSGHEKNSVKIATQLAAGVIEQVVVVGGVLFLIVAYFHTTWRDLGLPESPRQLLKDVFTGLVASLAALAPVYLIMYFVSPPEMKSGHPLVQMVSDSDHSVSVMLLVSFAVVVVAPICEEITFRLLLQGWLEKLEFRKAESRKPSMPVQVAENEQLSLDPSSVAPTESLLPSGAIQDESASDLALDSSRLLILPTHPLAGVQFAWRSIAISSLLFGLAHFGYGPEPIPLFFLALVLGYLYNRTHRIVPGIVAHAAFNSYTMIALWRMVFYSP